jgi:hypothetical protein
MTSAGVLADPRVRLGTGPAALLVSDRRVVVLAERP